MALYALTRIKHGSVNRDGVVEEVVYDENEQIDEGDFSEDELKALQEIGSVGALRISPEDADAERQKLLERIAELESQLSEGQGTARLKPSENLEGSDTPLEDQLAEQERLAVSGNADPGETAQTPSNPTGDPDNDPSKTAAKKTAASKTTAGRRE
jgi:hypothetical protein